MFMINNDHFNQTIVDKVNSDNQIEAMKLFMSFIFSLPLTTITTIDDIFRLDADYTGSVSVSIEYYTDSDDSHLKRFSFKLSRDGFIQQSLLRKEGSHSDSKWEQVFDSDGKDAICRLPLEHYNKTVFLSADDDHLDVTGLSGSNTDLMYSLDQSQYGNYYDWLAKILSSSVKARKMTANILRSVGMKDGFTSYLVTDVDVVPSSNGDRSIIMIYSAGKPDGISLGSCTVDYFKRFMLICMIAVNMYEEGSILILSDVDRILNISQCSRVLHAYSTMCRSRKCQMIACFSTTTRFENAIKAAQSRFLSPKLVDKTS